MSRQLFERHGIYISRFAGPNGVRMIQIAVLGSDYQTMTADEGLTLLEDAREAIINDLVKVRLECDLRLSPTAEPKESPHGPLKIGHIVHASFEGTCGAAIVKGMGERAPLSMYEDAVREAKTGIHYWIDLDVIGQGKFRQVRASQWPSETWHWPDECPRGL